MLHKVMDDSSTVLRGNSIMALSDGVCVGGGGGGGGQSCFKLKQSIHGHFLLHLLLDINVFNKLNQPLSSQSLFTPWLCLLAFDL